MIRLLIADDEVLEREALADIVARRFEHEITIETAENGRKAADTAVLWGADLILMDIEMESKYAGITATSQILREFPKIKIVILTVYEDDEMIYAAFQAGACDYVLKTATPAAMVSCVKDAYYEKSVIRPQVAKKLRKEFKRIKNNEDSLIYTIYLVQLLTDTERNILEALHEGKDQKEICRERFIEPVTMKTHIRNIVKKMKQKNIEDVLSQVEQSGYFYYMDKIKSRQEES